jgi:hypothetical protein
MAVKESRAFKEIADSTVDDSLLVSSSRIVWANVLPSRKSADKFRWLNMTDVNAMASCVAQLTYCSPPLVVRHTDYPGGLEDFEMEFYMVFRSPEAAELACSNLSDAYFTCNLTGSSEVAIDARALDEQAAEVLDDGLRKRLAAFALANRVIQSQPAEEGESLLVLPDSLLNLVRNSEREASEVVMLNPKVFVLDEVVEFAEYLVLELIKALRVATMRDFCMIFEEYPAVMLLQI